MTSRKNQQAARQYMREHDVPYMEALRRVASQKTSTADALANISSRPLDEPLVLGYAPLQSRSSKPSLFGRFRKKHHEDAPSSPAPYLLGGEGGRMPRLVTVYGPPGAGKTMLLRSILKQFRGHSAYIVHDGFLLDGPSLTEGREGEGIEPWEGLTDINLRPWMTGVGAARDLDAPTPPSISDLPLGSLVIFDLGGAGRLLESAGESYYKQKTRDVLRPWVEFEAELGRRAREKGLVVATSVKTSIGPEASMPLSLLGSPLSEASTKVRMVLDEGFRHPGGVWVYEAASPTPNPVGDHFLLTEQEARQVTEVSSVPA